VYPTAPVLLVALIRQQWMHISSVAVGEDTTQLSECNAKHSVRSHLLEDGQTKL
jgi:hypothetical protein